MNDYVPILVLLMKSSQKTIHLNTVCPNGQIKTTSMFFYRKKNHKTERYVPQNIVFENQVLTQVAVKYFSCFRQFAVQLQTIRRTT